MARKTTRVKVLSSQQMFRGRVFKIHRDVVIEPSGIRALREIVVHPGSVVVLPVFPDGRILLIRQYRYAAGRDMWELVAGHKEKGESFAAGAQRELQEEVGYSSRRMKELVEIFPSPGFLSERMVIFLAQGLIKGKPRPEDDEKITPRLLTLKTALHWIRSGKICDAKSVAGILYYSTFIAPANRRLRMHLSDS